MATCARCLSALGEGSLVCPQCGAAAGAEGRLGTLRYRIVGSETHQAAAVELEAGESVMAGPGALVCLRGGVRMHTTVMSNGTQARLQNIPTGGAYFLVRYTAVDTPGEAVFAACYPGTIQALAVGERQWLCQKPAFLCCSPRVAQVAALNEKVGYGLLSGEGFTLRTLGGEGGALVHAGGYCLRVDLGDGEQLRVDADCVVAFEAGVKYRIEYLKGLKNLLFGGEGLFLVALTGPGTVLLQTLSASGRRAGPLRRLAGRVVQMAG